MYGKATQYRGKRAGARSFIFRPYTQSDDLLWSLDPQGQVRIIPRKADGLQASFRTVAGLYFSDPLAAGYEPSAGGEQCFLKLPEEIQASRASNTHRCVYIYICIYVYMYICIYVYMYICICAKSPNHSVQFGGLLATSGTWLAYTG